MKNLINCTPHALVWAKADGTTVTIQPSGTIARVSASYTDYDQDGVCRQVFGDVTGLPAQQDDTLIIVSALVVMAASDRTDLVAPDTGRANRNDAGQIVSVPGFVRK